MSANGGPVFQLAGLLPYLIPLLAVVAMALMFLSVRHAREVKASGGHGGSASSPPEATALELPASRPLLQSIKLASAQLRRLVSGGAGVYEVPWVVAVGAGSADLDRLLPVQLAWPPDLAGAHRAVLGQVGRISFCRTGAVLSFDDGLLDGLEWRQRWQSLVRALQTCRPERPIDGLVVVIRASELVGSAEWHDRLVARGDQIYHLIWSVQRMTGWRIPVCMLVSGCEELTGFADWVLALPRQARQQVLGWSVPYALDTVFEPRWVDEGIEEVNRQLSVAQLLLMMPEPEVGVAEGLLLFPGETQRLAAPLSVLLTSMLRASAYHEAFMFRGFFLAGRAPGAVAQETRADAFAEALFTEKVFPEHKLAQPAYGEATRRHRQIRIAQAALAVIAVLCLIGVWHIGRVESDYFPSVSKLLTQIDQQVNARVLRRGNRQSVGALRERERDAALMLDAMAKIRIGHVDTIAAPTSLLTSANSRVEQAIAVGYRSTVLRAAFDVLTEKKSLVEILEPAPPPGATVPPAQQALATTVAETIDYDKHLQLYQRISTRPRIADLAALMEYALDVRLPPGFTERYHLYEAALRNAGARPIQTADVQPLVERIVQRRSDAAMRDAYTDSQLVTLVMKLASLAGGLTTAQGSPSAMGGRNLLADTQTTLDRIPDLLVLPSYDWLSGKPGWASPLLPLDKLRGLQVVRAGVIDGLLASGARAEADTRKRLLNATAFDGAPVLASGDGGVTLSPSMDASRRLLNGLFSQRFMQPVPAASTPATLVSGMRINWDIPTLRQAEDLAESFLAFAPKEDATLPRSIQQEVRSVAGAEAAANIGLLVKLAARPAVNPADGGSRAMLQDVSRLTNALPVLVNLRNTLRQAGATAAAAALDALVSGQAVRLLRQVDSDLSSAAPYRLADPNLSFWHGSPPLAEPAFGTSSPTDLASTLPPRRDFVEALARDYAAPLVSYLRDPGTSSSAGASGLVARWQSIIDTLDRYHRSDPSNSLTRLEQFITMDMDKIDLSNCGQLSAGGVMAARDYFAEQLQNIRQAIASRCTTVRYAGTVDRYTSLATTFNTQLAGRFPFSSVSSAGSAATGSTLGAADPNAVRRILQAYGPDLPTLQAQFQSGGSYGEMGRAAEAFLTQLLAVQTALATMLADPSGNTPLSYQVDVEFFTNPGTARGQNQVIDATVSTGAQRASSLNGTSRIVWTNGQPLRVRLRWAANAPMVPDARRPWPRINGLNADFDFGDNWALLRLIEAQAPGSADLNALQDRQPEVVEFDVPLQRNANSAIGGNTKVDTARVYMRLALTGVVQAPGQPQKTVPLALPDFPTAAPLLGRTMSYIGPSASAAPTQLTIPTVGSASQ